MIKITMPKVRNFLSNILGASAYSAHECIGFSHISTLTQKKVITDIGFQAFCNSWNIPLEYYNTYNYGHKQVKDSYMWQGLILPYLMLVTDNDTIIQASKEIIKKANNSHKLFNLFNILIKSPIIKNYQSDNNICNDTVRSIITKIDSERLNDIRKNILSLFIANLKNSYIQDYAISLKHISTIPLEYFPENSKNAILSFIFETNSNIALDVQYKCLSHICQLPGIITLDIKLYLSKIFKKRNMISEQLRIFELFKKFLTLEEVEQYNKITARKFIQAMDK